MCVDVFCGGAHDGSIKIWDARLNNDLNVLDFDCKIPNAHGKYHLITLVYSITYLLIDNF